MVTTIPRNPPISGSLVGMQCSWGIFVVAGPGPRDPESRLSRGDPTGNREDLGVLASANTPQYAWGGGLLDGATSSQETTRRPNGTACRIRYKVNLNVLTIRSSHLISMSDQLTNLSSLYLGSRPVLQTDTPAHSQAPRSCLVLLDREVSPPGRPVL